MNSFIKNNKQFFSLFLGLLLHSPLAAFTINNKPLESIIQPGDALLLTFPEENNVVVILEIENESLITKTANLDFLAPMLKGIFNKNNDKHSCPVMLMSPIISNVVSYKSSYLIGEQLNFQSKKLLRFINCLLESPSISITGNRMLFDDSFLIDPETLYLFTDSLESNYQVIRILFYNEPKIPTVLAGSIDFLKLNKGPQTLVLSNVKAISIEFNPQVWHK